jgi:hypothetical protein
MLPKDIIIKILMELNPWKILSICHVSKKYTKEIINCSYFWHEKLRKDYACNLDDDINWKQLYFYYEQNMTILDYNEHKELLKDFDFNPERKVKSMINSCVLYEDFSDISKVYNVLAYLNKGVVENSFYLFAGRYKDSDFVISKTSYNYTLLLNTNNNEFEIRDKLRRLIKSGLYYYHYDNISHTPIGNLFIDWGNYKFEENDERSCYAHFIEDKYPDICDYKDIYQDETTVRLIEKYMLKQRYGSFSIELVYMKNKYNIGKDDEGRIYIRSDNSRSKEAINFEYYFKSIVEFMTIFDSDRNRFNSLFK